MHGSPTVTWLKIASAVVMGFGILLLLAAHPAMSAPVVLLSDLIFWPIDGTQSVDASETRLLSGILGGVMAGWGILLWMVSTRLYPREPDLARTLILTSIWVWFVVDGIGSTLAGAPLNVLLNVGFLALFVVPLWSARKRDAAGEPSGA